MNFPTNQSVPFLDRRPRPPRPTETDPSDRRSPFINQARVAFSPTPDRRNPGVLGKAPDDSELPLFCEIADQLQQHADIDRATAIRKARMLMEGAFRSLRDADETATNSDLRPQFM